MDRRKFLALSALALTNPTLPTVVNDELVLCIGGREAVGFWRDAADCLHARWIPTNTPMHCRPSVNGWHSFMHIQGAHIVALRAKWTGEPACQSVLVDWYREMMV